LCTIFLFRCEEAVLEPSLKGELPLKKLYQTEDGFLSALNGAYSPLSSGNYYDLDLPQFLARSSDDGWTWRKETAAQTFTVEPTFTNTQGFWSESYSGITRTNTLLSRLEGTDVVSGTVSEVIKGQAKFLRALYYFNLVRLFGSVPLITDEVNFREDATKSGAPIEEVFIQIKTDLGEAINLLPSSYSGTDKFKVGMATKGAAKTLKAKVHLEANEWNQAATLAQEVINSGVYELHANYKDNFYGNAENGKESIFEVQFSNSSGSVGASWRFLDPQQFGGGSGTLPTDSNQDFGVSTTTPDGLVQALESDEREEVTLSTYELPNFLDPTQPDGSLYHYRKYFDNNQFSSGQSPFNFPVLRLSEVYLIAAEALNEQGAGNPDAIRYVNKVRNRVGLSDVSQSVAQDQDAFRQAIRHERRVELAFEGKRFFDLNRWSILREEISKTGVEIDSEKFIDHPLTGKPYYLNPIPASELVNNPKLEQNPGY
jgi:hypothetical protein